MARLIDADALNADFIQEHTANADVYLAVRKIIENAPTVDAVEVVRCFECRNCEVVNNDITYAICKAPPKTLFLPFDIDTRTHFCSYGERKMNE